MGGSFILPRGGDKMAYDVGVRSELNNRGINNDRIGWDQNTGSVLVDNNPFLKPQKNYDGTTFTDLGSFNNAYKTFSNNQKVGQMQDQLTNYKPQQNPYTSQISDIVSQLTNRMNAPQNPNEVYNSPQYAAAQAQLGRQSHDGIRAAQESLGSSGFGRSTALSQSAQRVQNDASNYLNTQMVPQIANQLQAQKQAEMNNLMSMLNPLMQQQQFEGQQQQLGHQNLLGVLNYLNGQNQQQVENQRADSSLTGMYQGSPTLQAQNQQFNQGMAQQEQQYRQMRDQIMDERDRQKFDEDVRRFGLQYAADQAYRNGQLKLSQQGADLSREKFDWEKEFETSKDSTPKTTSYMNSIISQLNQTFGNIDELTGKITGIKDPKALRKSIIGMNLPDAETDMLLSVYGLPTN